MDSNVPDHLRLHLALALSREAKVKGLDVLKEGQLYMAYIKNLEGDPLTTWPIFATQEEINIARFLIENKVRLALKEKVTDGYAGA